MRGESFIRRVWTICDLWSVLYNGLIFYFLFFVGLSALVNMVNCLILLLGNIYIYIFVYIYSFG